MTIVFEQRRADPTVGVLETMLVLDGEPVELEAHLARLRHSLGELYGQDLPADLTDELREQSRGIERGKARVVATPTGASVECTSVIGGFCTDVAQNSPTVGVALHSLTVPGGFGPHKWADRSLLEEAEAGMPAGSLALIVDTDGGAAGDGTALEASRANVFAVRRGALFTPPLDGRILPGVTRARVLALAAAAGIETREEPLTAADLRDADGVFLTASVRGVEPVRTLDGAALGRADRLSPWLADALQRAWRGNRSPVG